MVVLYTTFGSELLEKGFIGLLSKKNKFPDLLRKDLNGKINIPSSKELPEIAEKLAQARKTNAADELKKLTKQKAFVGVVPYLFSIVAMGFTLSAITRLWTQHRYNVEHKNDKKFDKTQIAVKSFGSLTNISKDSLLFKSTKID